MKNIITALLLFCSIAIGAQQTINVGTTSNDGTGDTLRSAFQKVNSNFTELYASGDGDVNGPGSSTDNSLATFNGTGGDTLASESKWTVDANGLLYFTDNITDHNTAQYAGLRIWTTNMPISTAWMGDTPYGVVIGGTDGNLGLVGTSEGGHGAAIEFAEISDADGSLQSKWAISKVNLDDGDYFDIYRALDRTVVDASSNLIVRLHPSQGMTAYGTGQTVNDELYNLSGGDLTSRFIRKHATNYYVSQFANKAGSIAHNWEFVTKDTTDGRAEAIRWDADTGYVWTNSVSGKALMTVLNNGATLIPALTLSSNLTVPSITLGSSNIVNVIADAVAGGSGGTVDTITDSGAGEIVVGGTASDVTLGLDGTITRDTELSAHASDTTAIHGITDTSTLLTASALSGAVLGSGTPDQYAIPMYSSTSPTNITASAILSDSTGTNLYVGAIQATNLVFESGTASRAVGTDASKNFVSAPAPWTTATPDGTNVVIDLLSAVPGIDKNFYVYSGGTSNYVIFSNLVAGAQGTIRFWPETTNDHLNFSSDYEAYGNTASALPIMVTNSAVIGFKIGATAVASNVLYGVALR